MSGPMETFHWDNAIIRKLFKDVYGTLSCCGNRLWVDGRRGRVISC